MVKNIISKGKMHKGKANVNIRDDMRKIISLQRVSRKHSPVQMIGNSY